MTIYSFKEREALSATLDQKPALRALFSGKENLDSLNDQDWIETAITTCLQSTKVEIDDNGNRSIAIGGENGRFKITADSNNEIKIETFVGNTQELQNSLPPTKSAKENFLRSLDAKAAAISQQYEASVAKFESDQARAARKASALASPNAQKMSDVFDLEVAMDSVRSAFVNPEAKDVRSDIVESYNTFKQNPSFKTLEPLLVNCFDQNNGNGYLLLLGGLKQSDAKVLSQEAADLLAKKAAGNISEEEAFAQGLEIFRDLKGRRESYEEKRKTLADVSAFFPAGTFEEFAIETTSRTLGKVKPMLEDNRAARSGNDSLLRLSLGNDQPSFLNIREDLEALEEEISDFYKQNFNTKETPDFEEAVVKLEQSDNLKAQQNAAEFKKRAKEIIDQFEAVAPIVARQFFQEVKENRAKQTGKVVTANNDYAQPQDQQDNAYDEPQNSKKTQALRAAANDYEDMEEEYLQPNKPDGDYEVVAEEDAQPTQPQRPSTAPAVLQARPLEPNLAPTLPARPQSAPPAPARPATRGILGALRSVFSRIANAFRPNRTPTLPTTNNAESAPNIQDNFDQPTLSADQRLEFFLDEMKKRPLALGNFRLSTETKFLTELSSDKNLTQISERLSRKSGDDLTIAVAAAIKKSLRDGPPIIDPDLQTKLFSAANDNQDGELDAKVAEILEKMPIDKRELLEKVLDVGIRVYKAEKTAEKNPDGTDHGTATGLSISSVAVVFGPNLFAAAEKHPNPLAANALSLRITESLMRARERSLQVSQEKGSPEKSDDEVKLQQASQETQPREEATGKNNEPKFIKATKISVAPNKSEDEGYESDHEPSKTDSPTLKGKPSGSLKSTGVAAQQLLGSQASLDNTH